MTEEKAKYANNDELLECSFELAEEATFVSFSYMESICLCHSICFPSPSLSLSFFLSLFPFITVKDSPTHSGPAIFVNDKEVKLKDDSRKRQQTVPASTDSSEVFTYKQCSVPMMNGKVMYESFINKTCFVIIIVIQYGCIILLKYFQFL